MVHEQRLIKTRQASYLNTHQITCGDSCRSANPISKENGHLRWENEDSRGDVEKRKM